MNDMLLSKRAAIEQSSMGVGVSTTARMYWRAYWSQKNMPQMLGANKEVNEYIAGDFKGATPMHRFWLTKAGAPVPAEIRRSHNFYYVAKMQGPSKYDVIAIQPRYVETDPERSKQTLTQEWVQRGPRRKK